MSCNGTEDVRDVEMTAERRQGIHLCDEQTKLRLANEIVEAINHCLLDKMAKTSSCSEGHLLSMSPMPSTSEAINDRMQSEKKYENAIDLSDFGDTAEHSSSIREFKRLGAYCTLRPEQRRKHLLKALPTLRNSRILQTLLATADNQPMANGDSTSLTNKHVIDDLLCNLDHIIGGEVNKNGNASVVSECNGERVAIDGTEQKLDPKIEDCLRELDVYLEEIDRDYAMACAYGSSATSCNYGKMAQRPIESDESLILLDNMETIDDSDDSERKNCNASNKENDVQIQHFSTNESHMMRTFSSSDTNINQCDITMNNLLFKENADQISAASSSNNNNGACSSGSSPLKRGHQTRNTIGGGDGMNGGGKMVRLNPLHRFNASPRDATKRSSNWRRSSMRKTKPIILPQTDENLQPEINQIQCEYESISRPDELCVADEQQQLENETQLNYIPLDDDTNIEVTPASNDTSTIDLHSLNNEFLTTILASPRAMCEENNSIEAHLPESRTMLNDCNVNSEIARPRQMGRRSEVRSRIVSITAERNAAGNQRIIVNCDTDRGDLATHRRNSSTSLLQQQQQQQIAQRRQQQLPPQTEPSRIYSNESSSRSIASELSSGASSRNPSPVSLLSSSESSSADGGNSNVDASTLHRTMNCASDAAVVSSTSSNNHNNSNNNANISSNSRRENMSSASKASMWPTGFSRVLAALSCTIGLFNISRFSVFSILFGANFMIQFLILSIFFGIPMMWLQMCLGSNIKRGPISMWRVSPICRGIGIALVVVQGIMAIYSAIALAWLLVFIRDSCVSSRYPWYRWQEVNEFFRGPTDDSIAMISNTSEPTVSSAKLGETVADYFNAVVLERFQLGPAGAAGRSGLGGIRFQMAFNVTVLWLIVFIVLCKGLRSYGKIVFLLMVLPMIGLAALCIKMLTMLRLNSIQNIFATTNWSDFFINSQSWMSAAQETFLTWSLLGASLISIFSRSSTTHTHKTHLRRDAIIVVIITLFALFLAALLGNTCVQILNDRGYYYFPGSFETISSSVFLLPSNKPLSPQLATSLSKWLPRYSTLLGESYRRHDGHTAESGWQAIRLATELFPATVAAATNAQMSSFWTLLGFCVFLFFGIGQLCAMWQPIAAALGNNTKSNSTMSTTTLLSCLIGCFLGIPLVTERAMNIIHFLDTAVGGAWFVLLLWTTLIFAIFLVRGRPYSGDIIVNDLRFMPSLSAFVALSWNLMIPTGLLTLCVLEYKLSYSHDFFRWTSVHVNAYWPIWARKMAACIQIGIFQIVPITSIIQSYRYLSRGPPDILDRFQSLYRPLISASPSHRSANLRQGERMTARSNIDARQAATIPDVTSEHISLESGAASLTLDDPPPKYTPPPSYTAVTGSRIAKMLRNSIRRSVRRIMGEPSSSCNNRRPTLTQVYANTMESSIDDHQLPPSYSTVSRTDGVCRTQTPNTITLNTTNELNAQPMGRQINRNHSIDAHRRHTTTIFPSIEKIEKTDSFSSTIPRRPGSATTNQIQLANCHLTAEDVARLLRSTAPFQFSIQAPTEPIVGIVANEIDHQVDSDNDAVKFDEQQNYSLTQSIEQLVLNEVPIGESTAAAVAYINDADRNHSDDDCTH